MVIIFDEIGIVGSEFHNNIILELIQDLEIHIRLVPAQYVPYFMVEKSDQLLRGRASPPSL